MPIERQTLVIAGLQIQIFSHTEFTADLGRPLAILFFLHGRGSSWQTILWVIEMLFDQIARKLRQVSRTMAIELKIVAFDIRNHGTRLVDKKANDEWSMDPNKHNKRFAIDMYSIQLGTARDVSFLIDFLPPYLFPLGERTVTQWLVSGISLGGHAAWLAFRNGIAGGWYSKPRLHMCIPIVGSPDYLAVIGRVGKRMGIQILPPNIPDSLRTIIKRNDPIHSAYQASDASNPFNGKKILMLCGGMDMVTPWPDSSRFYQMLNVGCDGLKKAVVFPGVAHHCTPDMVTEMANFIWDESLCNSTAVGITCRSKL